MKLSVITACYNMEGYIAETLKSVSGSVGDFEHIVIDGGSNDRSLDLIRQHQPAVTKLVSEPDEGQYHAINKGFRHATGEVMCWINADDVLMPWTVSVVTEIFAKFPDVMWITGLPSFLNEKGQLVKVQSNLATFPQKFIANGWYSKNLAGYLQQESMFWRRSLWNECGGLDLRYKLAADFDLWTRFAKIASLVAVDIPLAAFRERPGAQRSSTQMQAYEDEVAVCCARLPKAGVFWRFIATRGVIFRNLFRLILRQKSEAIVYSRKTLQWTKINSKRSISRHSLAGLIAEFKLRSQV